MAEVHVGNDTGAPAAAPAPAAESTPNAQDVSTEPVEAQVRDVILTVVDSVFANSLKNLAQSSALESAVDADVLETVPPAPAPASAAAGALDVDDFENGSNNQQLDHEARLDDQTDDVPPAADAEDVELNTANANGDSSAIVEEAEGQGLLKSPRRRLTALDIDVGVDLSESHEQLVEEAKLVLAMIDGHHLAYVAPFRHFAFITLSPGTGSRVMTMS